MSVEHPDWAACVRLPMSEVDELFYLEGASRTARAPKADTHAVARRLCASCPILAECLAGAFTDAYMFRGGLSPEERASFGGPLMEHTARRRHPRFTRAEVWQRVVMSPLPHTVIATVLRNQADLSGPTAVRDGGSDQWKPPSDVA